jgi:hypothetical protein
MERITLPLHAAGHGRTMHMVGIVSGAHNEHKNLCFDTRLVDGLGSHSDVVPLLLDFLPHLRGTVRIRIALWRFQSHTPERFT